MMMLCLGQLLKTDCNLSKYQPDIPAQRNISDGRESFPGLHASYLILIVL